MSQMVKKEVCIWLEKWLNLSSKRSNLEKGQLSIFQARNGILLKESNGLREFSDRLKDVRELERAHLAKRTNELKSLFDDLQDHLSRNTFGESFNKRSQHLFDTIDKSLQVIKSKSNNQYEKLNEQEILLFRETSSILTKSEKMLKARCKAIPCTDIRVPTRMVSSNEVSTISNTLMKMGNGGWSDENHNIFLRFLTQRRIVVENVSIEANNNKIISQLNDLLPDLGTNTIEEHLKWYKEKILLERKRRKALEMWRKEESTPSETETEMRIRQFKHEQQQEKEAQKQAKELLYRNKLKKKLQAYQKVKEEKRIQQELENQRALDYQMKKEQIRQQHLKIKQEKLLEYKQRKQMEFEMRLASQNLLEKPFHFSFR
eukprot:TRINITY_DN1269_c0_g1_i3.p1 TRINITY_DN1269_c0_g1~~TRINITY_DN1269_c0_g1_i3.p1  ORF type:complete len:374 (-),score=60.49 TRINITY_DN1269_c0_g1_i3:502-1623(-)